MPLPDAFVRKPSSRDPSAASRPHPRSARWLLVASLAMIAAGLALWHDAALNQALFHAVNRLGPDAPALWSSLSVAGLGLAAWIYLAAFAERRPARVARLLWILIVGGVVIHFIKHGFGTPRPLLALGDAAVEVTGERLRTQSMPSGHSAMAFAMLALMASEIDRPSLPRLQLAGCALLALGIALSRVAVGAHWPADALFGGGLGVLFAGLSERAWPVAAAMRFLARPPGQRLVAIVLAISALSIAMTPDVLAVFGLADSKLERQFATGYPLAQPLQWVLALMACAGTLRWWRAASRGTAGA